MINSKIKVSSEARSGSARQNYNSKFKKKVFIVGNLLDPQDNLPLRLLSKLRKAFPGFEFIETDPTENFVPSDNSIIIDTVIGINEVRVFSDIDDFIKFRSVSVHDYDLGLQLQLLKKLGKLKTVKIIGIPVNKSVAEIKKQVHKAVRLAGATN